MRAAWPLVMPSSEATEFQSICGLLLMDFSREGEDGARERGMREKGQSPIYDRAASGWCKESAKSHHRWALQCCGGETPFLLMDMSGRIERWFNWCDQASLPGISGRQTCAECSISTVLGLLREFLIPVNRGDWELEIYQSYELIALVCRSVEPQSPFHAGSPSLKAGILVSSPFRVPTSG